MTSLSDMKARQSAKIRQLAEVAGIPSLDELALAFGVPRSTAWTIRSGQHKASGLSAAIINPILYRVLDKVLPRWPRQALRPPLVVGRKRNCAIASLMGWLSVGGSGAYVLRLT